MSSIFNCDITGAGLAQSASTPSSVWNQLAESKEFREEFSAQQLKRGIAFEIRALLKKRGWKQEKLAENAKLTQGVVSRAQNPDYGNLTINTINRVSAGFDVAFVGTFVPFSELVEWFENLSEEVGEVEPFEKEYQQFIKRKFMRFRTRRRNRRKLGTRCVSAPPGIQQGAISSGASRAMQVSLLLSDAKLIQMPSREQTPAGMLPTQEVIRSKVVVGGF